MIPIQETGALDWQGWVTISVFVLVLIGLIREIASPGIVMLAAAAILAVVRVITPAELLMGFSRPIVFTLAMLFVVVRAIQTTGLLGLVATSALPSKGGYRRRLATLMLPISAVSAFLNNTPIVLILTSVVRKWAQENNHSPSKYLIPVSIAAIFGGMCTLIGTAGNLVVDGLLREVSPLAQFTFFELALVGLPCLVVGYLFFLSIGCAFLPDRKDPTALVAEQAREFTGEFLVEEDSVMVDKPLSEASRRYFHGEYLIEIRRDGRVIDSPAPQELIRANDRLVFAGDLGQIAKLHAIKGLTSLADPEFRLDPKSSHVAEVAIAIHSPLIGKTLRRSDFRRRFGASVVSVYRQGRRVEGSVPDIVLRGGDTLILISNIAWEMSPSFSRHFYPVKVSEALPVFTKKRATFVIVILVLMIAAVTMGIPILYASLVAAGVLLITRSVSLREARLGIDWHLLLLVASAFALGGALYNTGVAHLLAEGVISVVGDNPYLLIGGVFLLTMIITELITNTAAALMLFPIAVETARVAGYDTLTAVKAIGVTVAIAASSSFLTPIGYQTNTIVYGPGGYRFTDYARVGWGLSILQLVVATSLIPWIWPLS